MSKPVLIYVDDEPHNLTILEATLPTSWEVITFNSPTAALAKLPSLNPWVVLSDQRMPGLMGVEFLEIVKRTHPDAKRLLVTGYSDEDLIIDSIRKAGVHDYIRKPWDSEDLEHRLNQVVQTYALEQEVKNKTLALEAQNAKLKKLMFEVENSKKLEETMRKELESWAPPFLLEAVQASGGKSEISRDLAMIAIDIVNSSRVYELFVKNRNPLGRKSRFIQDEIRTVSQEVF